MFRFSLGVSTEVDNQGFSPMSIPPVMPVVARAESKNPWGLTPQGLGLGTMKGTGDQPFLAQALHQPAPDTFLPANKGQPPALSPALPWNNAQLAQFWSGL